MSQRQRGPNSHSVTIEVYFGLRLSTRADNDTPGDQAQDENPPLAIESDRQILLDHADDSK
jgi:hypothetical protein